MMNYLKIVGGFKPTSDLCHARFRVVKDANLIEEGDQEKCTKIQKMQIKKVIV
jgi:hypothetical protein